jgi:hypothetical protein
MKRYLIISTLFLAACGGQKQGGNDTQLSASLVNNPHSASGMDTVAAAMKPVMEFRDTLHKFGDIKENEVVSYDFSFTNTGKTPLIITSASGSCGCTVPDFPHEPILPGQAAIMKVTFNSSGKQGHQEKSVTIVANTVRNVHMLYIQAEVAKAN